MAHASFPALADHWEPSRATLHAYAKALDALPQAHVTKHPAWWHISLKPRPNGLATSNIALPDGGLMNGLLDFRNHEIVLESSSGWRRSFSAREGRTGTQMAEALIDSVEEIGLTGEYVRKDFEDDAAGKYDEAAVAPFWTALTSVTGVFEAHRATLDHRSVSPVQFWPHGFDLAFEWFGTKQAEEGGTTYPSQLNLGFYSAGRPYFYSNPFPFSGDEVRKMELSVGAWCDEMFEGSILYYDEVADSPDVVAKLATYAREVFEAASPTLMA